MKYGEDVVTRLTDMVLEAQALARIENEEREGTETTLKTSEVRDHTQNERRQNLNSKR
jgi:hypothetical protein